MAIAKNANYYQTMFALSDEELAKFRSTTAQLQDDVMSNMYTEFYEWMDGHNLFGTYYTNDVIGGVKANEEVLWSDTVGIPMDDEYIDRQQFFGQTFASMGVPYEAYFGAIIAYHQLIHDYLEKQELLSIEFVSIFKKVTSVAAAIIADTYNEATSSMLREQNKALMEMSTPATQLWEGILFLPLVGFIDSKRAQETMTIMLDLIAQTQAKVFILDISGVAVVDTAVANYLIRMTKATRLMGCRCIISGISASVAQTIVELGIQIDEIDTTGNMVGAINFALAQTGATVTHLEETI